MTYAEKTKEVRLRVVRMWADALGCDNTDALLALSKNFFNIEFARPFIVEDINKGLDAGLICKRYGITYSQLFYFKCRLGICNHSGITTQFPDHGIGLEEKKE